MNRPPALSGVRMYIFSCNLRNPAPQGRSPRVSIHALYDCRSPSAANHPHRARVQLPAGPIVRSDQGLSRAFRIIFRLGRRRPTLAESALAIAPAPPPTQTSQDGAPHTAVGNHRRQPAKRTRTSQRIPSLRKWCTSSDAPARAGPLRHLSPDCPRFNSLFHGFLGREPHVCRGISAPVTTSPPSAQYVWRAARQSHLQTHHELRSASHRCALPTPKGIRALQKPRTSSHTTHGDNPSPYSYAACEAVKRQCIQGRLTFRRTGQKRRYRLS